MSKYIGTKKIVDQQPEAEGLVTYKLEDGTNATVRADQFESMAKEEAYEDGMVRVYKWNPAVSKVMEILLAYDMTLLEKDFVINRIDATIIENYGKAAAKLFGSDFEHNIKLSQIHKALLGEKVGE